MDEEFICASKVHKRPNGSDSIYFPVDSQELLGDPDEIAWFLDRDSGRLYVVPKSEVSMR